MEKKLLIELLNLSKKYCEFTGLQESTLGRKCANDGRFFFNLRKGKTITLRKYASVIKWLEKELHSLTPPQGNSCVGKTQPKVE